MWITGRGMSESPWITRRSEHACITDVPQCGDKLDLERHARSVQNAGWCCKKKKVGHKNKDPEKEFRSRNKTLPYRRKTSFAAGEGGRGVTDCDC